MHKWRSHDYQMMPREINAFAVSAVDVVAISRQMTWMRKWVDMSSGKVRIQP